MDEAAIIRDIAETFAGVDIEQPQPGSAPEIAIGDTFFIYDPNRNLEGKFRFPFATIVTKDYGDFDRASNLNRAGVFRLNIGIGKESYHKLFGPQPTGTGAAGHVETGHDFTALDQLMPHPVYATQFWVSVLNPSEATFATIRPLLAEAYAIAVERFEKVRPSR